MFLLYDPQEEEGAGEAGEWEPVAEAVDGAGEQQQQREGAAAGRGAMHHAGGCVLELKPGDFVQVASHGACGAYHWTQWVAVRLWDEEVELEADRKAPRDQVCRAAVEVPYSKMEN